MTIDLERFTRTLGPQVEELQHAVEPVVGTLLWKPARETRLITHTERQDFVRVGPIIGDGVAMTTVDPDELRAAVAAVAARHGYPEPGPVVLEDNEYKLTVDDQIGTQLQVRVGVDVRLWADTEALHA